MSLEQQLRQAVHHVADRTPVPEVDLDAVRARARTNWRPRVAVAVTAAVVVIILAATSLLIGRSGSKPEPLGPVKPPGILVGAVPVWYDAAGLHRGDVVEKTPVTLFTDTNRMETHVNLGGVLALVRRGALYRDLTNDDVWFHPWGGEPRVVGHDSSAGPGGDPDGDVAHGSTARSSSSTTPHAVASSPARNPAMTIPSYCGTRGWSVTPAPST